MIKSQRKITTHLSHYNSHKFRGNAQAVPLNDFSILWPQATTGLSHRCRVIYRSLLTVSFTIRCNLAIALWPRIFQRFSIGFRSYGTLAISFFQCFQVQGTVQCVLLCYRGHYPAWKLLADWGMNTGWANNCTLEGFSSEAWDTCRKHREREREIERRKHDYSSDNTLI